MLKNKTIFVSLEMFHLPHRRISLWEDRTFHYKPQKHLSWLKRLEGVFCLRLQKRRLQDILVETNIFVVLVKYLQDVFKTSSRLLQDVLKTYHQVKLFLLVSLRDVVNTFLRRTAKMVYYSRIRLSHTSDKVTASVQNLQEWYKFLKF